jgi:hypothetical protein
MNENITSNDSVQPEVTGTVAPDQFPGWATPGRHHPGRRVRPRTSTI